MDLIESIDRMELIYEDLEGDDLDYSEAADLEEEYDSLYDKVVGSLQEHGNDVLDAVAEVTAKNLERNHYEKARLGLERLGLEEV